MNNYVKSALTLLGVFAAGLILVLSFKSIDVTINVSDKEKDKVENTQVQDNNTTVVSEKKIEKLPQLAKLSGKICYPSEVIPPLSLFLVNIDTDQTITKNTTQNQASYFFEDLAPGSYRVYAKVTSQLNDTNSNIGGYTPAIECGLTVECTNHDLIEINLQSDVNFDTADICDWYGVKL